MDSKSRWTLAAGWTHILWLGAGAVLLVLGWVFVAPDGAERPAQPGPTAFESVTPSPGLEGVPRAPEGRNVLPIDGAPTASPMGPASQLGALEGWVRSLDPSLSAPFRVVVQAEKPNSAEGAVFETDARGWLRAENWPTGAWILSVQEGQKSTSLGAGWDRLASAPAPRVLATTSVRVDSNQTSFFELSVGGADARTANILGRVLGGPEEARYRVRFSRNDAANDGFDGVEAEVGADGYFALRGTLPGRGQLLLLAVLSETQFGSVVAVQDLDLAPGAEEFVEFEVSGQRRLHIVLRDASSRQRLDAATVNYLSVADGRRGMVWVRGARQTITLASGPSHLLATAPGYAAGHQLVDMTAAQTDWTVEFDLERLEPYPARLVDATGAALALAKVSFGNLGSLELPQGLWLSTDTDPDGRARVEFLPPGRYFVDVRTEGQTWSGRVDLAAGDCLVLGD